MLMRQWKWLLWAPIMIGLWVWLLNRPGAAAAQTGAGGVTDFAPLPGAAEAGWLVVDGALYRTTDGGAAWERFGPEAPAAAAFVLDDAHAWLVLAGETAGARLARTADGGQSWGFAALPLDLRERPVEALHLQFLDARTGWLTVRWAARRNFSQGTLFETRDGGETWAPRPLPLGGPGRLAAAEVGWLAGGPDGEALFNTVDGGRTWLAAAPPAQGEGRREVLAPLFPAGPEAGFLPVLERGPAGDWLAWHATTDGGRQWQLEERVALPAGVQRLAWATRAAGWALAGEGRCDEAACWSTARLWRTADGGRTWAPLPLPGGLDLSARAAPAALTLAAPPQALNLAPANTRVQTATGQGFDSCTMPTLDEMQTWSVHSPYRVWNLYLGGASRANCGTLTAGYLAALAVQGWRFIPTWVGPQAACSGFLARMSYDLTLAYQQGVAEADLAVDRAAALGLTFGDRTGTVLYYDLEAYDVGNSACRAAASAFISGWTAQVRARGNVAGVYGATCTSALSDFAGIANVPDAIWAAYWLLPAQYRSNASVFGLPCLDDSLWNGGQRLRQYSGGHNETWGGTTLNIDSNVLAGVVADLRDPRGQTSVALELYQGADYATGTCAVNLPGWFNLSGCGAGWEDQVSSLKVGAGWSVRLYRDADLAGPSTCVVLSDPSLDNDLLSNGAAADNQASSVKIYTNTSCWDHQTYVPLVRK